LVFLSLTIQGAGWNDLHPVRLNRVDMPVPPAVVASLAGRLF
jgi:hypothetical protein